MEQILQKNHIKGLSGNALKLIAAVSMLLDHIGVVFFPNVLWLRLAGRLALPIFAYMIAEGCHYTKNRLRYFLTVFGVAVCQTVYAVAMGDYYMCILVTFSLSILTVYALQIWKAQRGILRKAAGGLLFGAVVGIVWWLNRILRIDYGFWGCMLPVFPALLRGTKWDKRQTNILLLTVGLVVLCLDVGSIQVFSLAAVPLLLLYNGQRGKRKLKYFFYLFYPLHLAALQGIACLLALLK